jgi:hypothetical protein
VLSIQEVGSERVALLLLLLNERCCLAAAAAADLVAVHLCWAAPPLGVLLRLGTIGLLPVPAFAVGATVVDVDVEYGAGGMPAAVHTSLALFCRDGGMQQGHFSVGQQSFCVSFLEPPPLILVGAPVVPGSTSLVAFGAILLT